MKQGDPFSPNIFNSVLEEIFQKLDWEGKGVKINGQWLNNLRFAGDIVLISSNMDELKVMVEQLCKESRKAGLIINLSKTKIMSNGEARGLENELVSEYKYLG